MKKNWKKICLFLIIIFISVFALYNIFKPKDINLNNQSAVKQEDVNNQSFAEQEVNKEVNNETSQTEEQKTTRQVAKQLDSKDSSNKQADLKEFVSNKQIANISQCSDDFMNIYFAKANALNEKINKEDEETRERNKI